MVHLHVVLLVLIGLLYEISAFLSSASAFSGQVSKSRRQLAYLSFSLPKLGVVALSIIGVFHVFALWFSFYVHLGSESPMAFSGFDLIWLGMESFPRNSENFCPHLVKVGSSKGDIRTPFFNYQFLNSSMLFFV